MLTLIIDRARREKWRRGHLFGKQMHVKAFLNMIISGCSKRIFDSQANSITTPAYLDPQCVRSMWLKQSRIIVWVYITSSGFVLISIARFAIAGWVEPNGRNFTFVPSSPFCQQPYSDFKDIVSPLCSLFNDLQGVDFYMYSFFISNVLSRFILREALFYTILKSWILNLNTLMFICESKKNILNCKSKKISAK